LLLMAGTLGPLDLLVIQPTPFCNLDCTYCYLPDRQNKRRITPALLDHIFARVFASAVVQGPFTVVWHAGEPLVLRPQFYAQAFAIVARHNHANIPVTHSYQTNGTLIDEEWCDFIVQHNLRIGVSVDGPDFLNDTCRKTRRGGGTHKRVMEGIARLQRHHIPFHVITVLTLDALDYPDELYAFYGENHIQYVGFNIEEIEGPNQQSSLSAAETEQRFRQFMSRFFDLVTTGSYPLRVRELDSMIAAIVHGGSDTLPTQETAPFAILSVDYQGNFSSFSPELLGLGSPRYGNFILGNMQTDSPASVIGSPQFRALHEDIVAGIAQCKQVCPYFRFCGGGAPVNKYFENGSFNSTETLFCRLNRKAMLDVVLDKLQGSSLATLSPRTPCN
jgi:uncharacterized protein